ncbi:MAG TPA: hypothetical protein EYP35_11865 [Desulfobacterales bacterium]|nr:hypothetical protein [Desulfobacterales bacterium]
MGLLATTILRMVFYAIALLINFVASIVLVRKLKPADYAVFQFVNRRLSTFIVFPIQLLGFWAYRYEAEGLGGGLCLILFSLLYFALSSSIGFLVAYNWLNVTTIIALLVGLLLGLRSIFIGIRILLSNLRPVKFSLMILAYRIVYSISVVVLVYLLSLQLLGAFGASILALFSSIVIGYFWIRSRISGKRSCQSYIAEWIRIAYAPLLVMASNLVSSLDAVLAYNLWGPDLVAGFFAAGILVSLVSEVIVTGFEYLAAYVLQTRDYRSPLRTARVTVSLAIPLLAYVSVHRQWAIDLINPVYRWASIAIPLFAIARILEMLNAGLLRVFEGLQRGGAKAARKVSKLYMYTFTSALLYITVSLGGFILAHDIWQALVIWIGAHITRLAINIAVVCLLVNVREFLHESKKTITLIFIYYVFAYCLGLFLAPYPTKSTRFLDLVEAALLPFTAHYTLCTIALYALDKDTRAITKKLLLMVRETIF